jgi:hypothetical protein
MDFATKTRSHQTLIFNSRLMGAISACCEVFDRTFFIQIRLTCLSIDEIQRAQWQRVIIMGSLSVKNRSCDYHITQACAQKQRRKLNGN